VTEKVTISELIFDRNSDPDVTTLRPDPLYEPDALAEAVLLDVRFVPVVSVVVLLLDMRTALTIDRGDTAVLLVHRAARLSGNLRTPSTPGVWVIAGSVTRERTDSLSVTLTDIDNGILEIEGSGASLTIGAAKDIGPCAAAIEDGDLTAFLASVPTWESSIRVLARSTRGCT
jgi:hypothetical protein